MEHIEMKWLEQQIREWESKGWVSHEGAVQIRHILEMKTGGIPLPLLIIVMALGLAIAGMALIWGLSGFWYQTGFAFRIGLAAGLLLFSQIAVGAGMLRSQQGTWAGEAIAVTHILILGVALAIALQTYYVGWDTSSYLAGWALLSLPVIYLLRSAGAVILYALGVLFWAASGGPVNAPRGAAFMWILLVLLVPFYGLLQSHNDEIRLSVYSWTLTITVFAAFGLAALDAEYIPFLLLATLAAAIMLTGYSIDIRKAWGVPFRWFGRGAAAGSLLISSLPASWYGIARIQGFHWTTITVTVILFLSIMALLLKGVKKRFWGPVLYAGIPVIIAAETMLVRSGLYSSVPLIVSSIYLIFIGFYEMVQGIQSGHTKHTKFGVCVLLCLVAAFFWGGSVSPLVPVVAIVILALVLVQIRRTSDSRRDAAERARHRTDLRHNVTTVRANRKTRSRRKKQQTPVRVTEDPAVPAEETADTPDTAGTADAGEDMPEWMKAIHMPELKEEQKSPAPPADTVKPREPELSRFTPPVFHNPDDIPLPQAAPAREKTQTPAAPARPHGSPWGNAAPRPEREKHFTHSPWSSEGGDRK